MANKSDSKFYCDLHLHTKYSDGTSIPKQNVIDCAMKGMEIIAITDHDSTKGYAEAKKELEQMLGD